MAWVLPRFCKLQKGCTRLAAASDKVYQLLAHGRWFSPGTPVSSTTKTGRHEIAEILLKVALNKKNPKKINLITLSLIHNNATYLVYPEYRSGVTLSIRYVRSVLYHFDPELDYKNNSASIRLLLGIQTHCCQFVYWLLLIWHLLLFWPWTQHNADRDFCPRGTVVIVC
jgi:hypothetical protein